MARGSIITASVYLRRPGGFCKERKMNPGDLLNMKSKELQRMRASGCLCRHRYSDSSA